MIVDAPQLWATGLVLVTAPVLVAVHALMRGRRWGLPTAAFFHTVAWSFGLLNINTVLEVKTVFGVADVLAGAALLVAVWLGWFQVISVLNRGFSLQMMLELESQPQSRDDLAASYAGGRGLGWLLEKRVRGLEDLNLATRKNGDLHLGELQITESGRSLARWAALYKRLAGIGDGG